MASNIDFNPHLQMLTVIGVVADIWKEEYVYSTHINQRENNKIIHNLTLCPDYGQCVFDVSVGSECGLYDRPDDGSLLYRCQEGNV